MNINLALIADEFSGQPQVCRLPEAHCLDLERVQLVSGEVPLPPEPSVLYLVRAADVEAQLSALTCGSFLIVGKLPDAKLRSCKAHYLCLPSETSFEVAANRVLALKQRLDLWHMRLLYAAARKEPIQSLLELAEEVLHNPLLLKDAYGMLVLCVGASKYPQDGPVWERFIADESMGDGMLDALRLSVYGEKQTLTAPILTDHVNDGVVSRRLLSALHIGTDYYGSLTLIEENEKFTTGTLSLAKFFTDFLIDSIRHKDISLDEINSLPAFLKCLIDGTPMSKETLETSLKQWDWAIYDKYQVLYFRIPQKDSGTDALIHLTARNIQGIFPKAFVFTDDDGAAVILRRRDYAAGEESILAAVTDVNRQVGCKCGASLVFYDFRRLRENYEQSKLTEYYGELCDQKSGTYSYRTYSWEHLLQLVKRAAPCPFFLHPMAEELARYDKEYNTDYLNTLLTFLHFGMSKTLTAKRLFIHRNTMVYRLEKISQIIGLNLENEPLSLNEDFHLMLSCMILRYPSDIAENE